MESHSRKKQEVRWTSGNTGRGLRVGVLGEKDTEEIQQEPLEKAKIHHTEQTVCQGTEQSARAEGQERGWE